MSAKERLPEGASEGKDQTSKLPESERGSGALLALLRLLTREPPAGHDFKTCPVCKRYGITEI